MAPALKAPAAVGLEEAGAAEAAAAVLMVLATAPPMPWSGRWAWIEIKSALCWTSCPNT